MEVDGGMSAGWKTGCNLSGSRSAALRYHRISLLSSSLSSGIPRNSAHAVKARISSLNSG